jgi:hypothetical protein
MSENATHAKFAEFTFRDCPKRYTINAPSVDLAGVRSAKSGSRVLISYSSMHEKTLPLKDLSDAEWNYIEPHLPAPKGHGRPRIHDLREILNAIFYLLKSGCQWRLLPLDFPRDGPPSTTISEYGAYSQPCLILLSIAT